MPSELLDTRDDWRRLSRLVSPDVGIINRVDEAMTPYDHPRLVAVYARSCSPAAIFGSGQSLNPGGMGENTATAHVAALGEAIERYSACHVPRSRLRRATARELAPAPLADAAWIRAGADRPAVHWVRGVRLARDGSSEPAWIAASRVYFAPVDADADIATATSSGLACHRDPWRALRSALLEAIERDAVMVTWLRRASATPIRTALRWRSAGGQEVHFERSTQSYRLFALDSPVGVPVVLAIAFGAERQPAVAVGAAAGLDIATACRRALVEAHQTFRWATYLLAQGRRPPQSAADIDDFEQHVSYYLDPSRLSAFDFLGAGNESIEVDLDDARPGSAAADVATVVGRAADAGIDCFCADATAPDVRAAGFWVLRAVVPALYPLVVGTGARPDHPRAPADGAANPDPHPFP